MKISQNFFCSFLVNNLYPHYIIKSILDKGFCCNLVTYKIFIALHIKILQKKNFEIVPKLRTGSDKNFKSLIIAILTDFFCVAYDLKIVIIRGLRKFQ